MQDDRKRRRAAFISNMLEQPGTVSVRIRRPLYEQAKKECEKTGISVNDYISAAVAQRLWWELEGGED